MAVLVIMRTALPEPATLSRSFAVQDFWRAREVVALYLRKAGYETRLSYVELT